MLLDCSRTVQAAKVEAGLETDDQENSGLNTSMMDVVHLWCSGASFAQVCAKSKVRKLLRNVAGIWCKEIGNGFSKAMELVSPKVDVRKGDGE